MPTPIRSAHATRGEEAYGQIVPIEGDALLLPNTAVIEVRGLEGMRMRTEPPGWLLGFVDWREYELPVVSVEGLLGRPMPPRSRRTRLLIINSVGTGLHTGLLALVCQGYPHLTALNRTALQPVVLEARDPDELVLSRVRVANTQAIIPDLDAIEAKVAQAQGAVAAPAEDWRPGILQ
jgi:chemosensory pili system protein ChpC